MLILHTLHMVQGGDYALRVFHVLLGGWDQEKPDRWDPSNLPFSINTLETWSGSWVIL